MLVKNCPLCISENTQFFFAFNQRHYYRCARCHLTYLDPKQRLSSEEEKKRYDLHQNHPYDSNYRKFLDQLAMPLIQFLKPSDVGLDFGCGPSPTLSVMLNERGYSCTHYDPIYYPQKNLLNKKYDFISCSEVFEHMYHPNQELKLLLSLLKPKGFLSIMTSFLTDDQMFPQWHYMRENTHVCFYKIQTFRWIEKKYPLNLIYHSNNVVIYTKAF